MRSRRHAQIVHARRPTRPTLVMSMVLLTVLLTAGGWGDDPPAPEVRAWSAPAQTFHEPIGFNAIVERHFRTKAEVDNDRGSGRYPAKVGGSEGWDGVEYRMGNLTIAPASDDPLSPGSAMRFAYPRGLPANTGPGIAQTLSLGTPRDLYVRTSIRLGPTYRVGGVSNKLYFHRMDGQPRGEPFLSLHANPGANTFRLAVNFQGTPDNGRGFYFARAPFDALERNRWYVIETLLVMNSEAGVPDGIFRLWVDGTAALERTDVQYIRADTGVNTWAALHVSPTFGGSSGVANEGDFYWDLGDAYVSGRE